MMIACACRCGHNRPVNHYDRDYALTHSVPAQNWLFDALIELIAPQPGWRVLDVGCNTGELTARLATLQCRTTGLDLNPDAIAIARERFPTGDFRVGSLPPFDATGFDAIVASHLIEHLPDPDEFLRAARQRLRPGGRLVLATPNRHAWISRLCGAPFFDDPTHVRLYTARELRQRLRLAGFEQIITRTKRLYFPLAARLPERLHLAIPACGMGDHLLAKATAPSAHT